MFTPGLAIFYLATILRFSHACGVRTGFSNILSAGGSTLVPGYWSAVTRLLPTSPSRRRDNIDRASQILAQGVPPGVPRSYRALADHSNIPRSTLHHRARGRGSMEEKAQSQQYLTLWEEDVLIKYLLQMSDLGQSVRIKFIPALAFRVTCHQPTTDRPLKPPSRNWTKALEKRHLELIARRVKALD
jgi:hypothetical protein